MLIETERLLIRELKSEDKVSLIEMASDGSLGDVGFDIGCSDWMADWLIDAKKLTDMDDPKQDYLAYAIELKEKNIVIEWLGARIIASSMKWVLHILLVENTGETVMPLRL